MVRSKIASCSDVGFSCTTIVLSMQKSSHIYRVLSIGTGFPCAQAPRKEGLCLMKPLPLQFYRLAHGWTQFFVAEQIGSTEQSVGRWERGDSFPQAIYRQRLC